MTNQSERPNQFDVNSGINDQASSARRLDWAKRLDFTPTEAQVDCGLNDPSAAVRVAWARREDYIPSPSQIIRGICSDNTDIRIAFAKKKNFTPEDDHISFGLTDPDWGVRSIWVARMDYVMTDKMIKMVLDDESNEVLSALLDRDDILFLTYMDQSGINRFKEIRGDDEVERRIKDEKAILISKKRSNSLVEPGSASDFRRELRREHSDRLSL